MSRPVGVIIKDDSIDDLKEIQKEETVTTSFKLKKTIFLDLKTNSAECGYSQADIVNFALEAFFRRKGKK